MKLKQLSRPNYQKTQNLLPLPFLLLLSYSPLLTAGVSPACDPAVVSWFEAGLLARQAGVADEVGGGNVCASLHQSNIIIQFAVHGIAEVLMTVDPLHRENPLCSL